MNPIPWRWQFSPADAIQIPLDYSVVSPPTIKRRRVKSEVHYIYQYIYR
jgi:hypothetical protein